MSCPGLHCPGCSGGQSAGIAVAAIAGLVAAAETVRWVADRIWWIGSTVAVCFALAVAAASWLERWADARGARFAAAHGILSRADAMSMPAVTNVPPRGEFVTPGCDRPAIGRGDLHIHLHGTPTPEQAEVIRRAIGGRIGP